MKKLLSWLFSTVLLFNLFLPVSAYAKVDFRGGEELNLANENFPDDLMAAGALLDGELEVAGDTYLAGSMIDISGNFSDDLNVAGSQVTLAGQAADNLRAAGADVTVAMQIGGNAMLAGAQVTIDKNTVIDGDLYVAGANVVLNGHVLGDVYVTGARVVLDGQFDGNVKIDAEEVSLGEQAKIAGNFDYTSTEELDNTVTGQVGGAIHFAKYQPSDDQVIVDSWGAMSLFSRVSSFIVGLIMLLVVGLVLVLIAPKFSDQTNNYFIKRMGWSLLLGIVVIIVWFTVSVFLLFTLIGIPLAIISLALFGVVMYLAKVLAGFSIGSVLIGRQKTSWIVMLSALALGLLVYEIIAIIPFIGWIFNMVFVATAVGAMMWYLYDLRLGNKESKPIKANAAAEIKK
ncbi:MAG: polymer-forming cytoskeletal protein [Patescibacteria group bacterium]